MKVSLYNIEKEYLDIMNEVEVLEGELTEELKYKLKINESQLKSKSNAYLYAIKEKEALNSLIDSEIKRLNAIKKSNTTFIERLKNNLLNAVNLFGEFKTDFNTFGTRKSTSVEIEDLSVVPKEFKTVKIEEKADKLKIKEHLKNGKKIKGCSLKENINLKIS